MSRLPQVIDGGSRIGFATQPAQFSLVTKHPIPFTFNFTDVDTGFEAYNPCQK